MIIFREALKNDIDKIMILEKACFNEYTQESKKTYLERIEVFSQGFIIMENNLDFIGAVSSEIWKSQRKITKKLFTLGHSIKNQFDLNGDELYISSIGIFPNYRNNGYGLLLFNELIKNVKKYFPFVTKGILLINEEWKFAKKYISKKQFL
jgi:ribosomal-protein-alanine N-acetyltransferase